MSSLLQAEVISGLIVGAVMAVLGWLGRGILKSVGDDIKQSVVQDLSKVIDSKVSEKTAPIIAQFANNGGKTMKDGIDRLERGQAKQADELAEVKDMTHNQGKVLGEHIAFHKGQESKTAAKRAAPRKAVTKAVAK